MSNLITTAQVQMYQANVTILFQQEGSMLRNAVMTRPAMGKYRYFDQLRATGAVRRTSRHADTPLINSQHRRRRAELLDYEWADLVDEEDEIRILISPESAYAINAAHALGREADREIIAAFTRAAAEGEDGTTSTAFDTATYQIAAGGTGLTVAKLRQAARIMDVANVPANDRHFAYSPIAKEDLLATTEVTSADFNTVRALVMGDIDTFLGFKFHMLADQDDGVMLPLSGNDRSCFAWQMQTMGLGIGRELVTRMDRRTDKGYALQVYAKHSFGAVRVQEGVVEVIVDESA